jgi:hypothetical protein
VAAANIIETASAPAKSTISATAGGIESGDPSLSNAVVTSVLAGVQIDSVACSAVSDFLALAAGPSLVRGEAAPQSSTAAVAAGTFVAAISLPSATDAVAAE